MWWKQKELFAIQPEPQRAFDGTTYDPEKDYVRLNRQLKQVFEVMKDGKWRTLSEIYSHVNGSQASISARLRDLRKAKYGAHVVERRHIGHGVHQYRVTVQ